MLKLKQESEDEIIEVDAKGSENISSNQQEEGGITASP